MLALTCGGNLGQDPETKTLDSGQTVTTFSIGVASYNSGTRQKTTVWVKTKVWGKRGEQLATLLHKGDKCMATGVATLSNWTDRDGKPRTTLEMNASDITPMGRASDGGGSAGGARRARSEPEEPGKPDADFDDGDIPFIRWSTSV